MKRFFSSRLLTSGLRTSVIWGHMFTVMVADSPRLELRVPTEDSDPSREADVPMWKPEDLAKNLNWDLPTMGGRQFWGDIVFLSGWRIQHNVVTDHYRLLDSHDVRRAWGREEECRAALKTFQEKGQIPKMSGRAVILVHGIIRSSKSFSSLTKRLAETGATVVPFDYPSTRVDLETSTGYLQKVIDSLEGIEEIDFVVHSMGGILVRSYLKATEQNPDPRLRRMVMMGVPNHGARIANLVKDLGAFKMIFGPAGQELVEDVDGVATVIQDELRNSYQLLPQG